MPVCPKCRFEYRDGFTRCPDCECSLVEAISDIPVQEERAPEHSENFVFFANVQDGPLGEGVISLLRAYDIPYRRSYCDSGMISGLYTGKSFSGVNLYVPEDCLQEAQGLLSAQFDISDAEHVYLIMEEGYESEISHIVKWYKEESYIPVDCMEKAGKTYVVYGKDTVLAALHICDDGQVGIFLHPSHINYETFAFAISEVKRIAEERGIVRIWCVIPDDEICFSAMYRQYNFVKACSLENDMIRFEYIKREGSL